MAMTSISKRLFFVFAWHLLLVTSLFAENLPRPVGASDFLITKWTTEDGLPQNTVTAIVQTPDEYMWIGTFGGLVRFDGIKFAVFDSTNTPNFSNNRVLSLYCDSRGTLWIGSDNGEVYVFNGKRFEAFSSGLEIKRKAVWGFGEDGSGNLYISSESGVEMFSIDSNSRVVPGTGKVVTEKAAYEMSASPSGGVWVKIRQFRADASGNKDLRLPYDQLYIIKNGDIVPFDVSISNFPKDPLRVRFSDEGHMLVAGVSGVGVWDAEGPRELKPTETDGAWGNASIGVSNGNFWFQHGDGLFEVTAKGPVKHSLKGFVEGGSRVVYFDKEGNIWLGTQSEGLVRAARRVIRQVSEITDAPIGGSYAVLQDAKGTVWTAGSHVYRIDGNKAKQVVQIGRMKRSPRFRSLAVDRDDTVWVGADDGLYKVVNDKLVAVESAGHNYIQSLCFDRNGNLWIGTSNGLDVYRDGTYTHFTMSANGLADDSVHFVTQTKDGTIWIGTRGGLSRFINDRFENISIKDGLSGNFVRDILEDDDGSVWIATYGGGIVRFRNGQITPITKANGLPDNFISRILVDSNGSFWFLSNRGVFAARRDDLNRVADGEDQFLSCIRYDASDGLNSSEANGGHQPAGTMTKDGKMWFPMIKDIVIIDPSVKPRMAPKVLIERATAKSNSSQDNGLPAILDRRSEIDIEDGLRNLEISYTGFSWTKPGGLRFFYKLDGLDVDWVDAGTRRTAFYPYLPPGEYKFIVRAVTWDGVFNDSDAVLTVRVAQKLWESNWFIAVVIICLLGGVFLIFSFRLKHVQESRARQREFTLKLIEVQEGERNRIATELHDGLGQNLLLIGTWAKLAMDNGHDKDGTNQYLERISEYAESTLEETRTIVGNLRPQQLLRFGLTESIIDVLSQIRSMSALEIVSDIDNIDGILTPEQELSFFRIVQECMNNIIKHSGSASAIVTIKGTGDTISMKIRDFGRGLPQGDQSGEAIENGGFGFQSIAQRVELLGGELSMDSEPGRGVAIFIRVRVK